MTLRKRTQVEVDRSVKAGDYTGGYNFLAWLIWMRSFILLLFPGAMGFGFGFGYYGFPIMSAIAYTVGIFYIAMLGREFYQLKRKKSTM